MKSFTILVTVFFLLCLFSYTYIKYIHEKIYLSYVDSSLQYNDQYSIETHELVSKGATKEIPIYSRIMFRIYKTVNSIGSVVFMLILLIGCFVFVIYRKKITFSVCAIVLVELILSLFLLQKIIV